MHKKDYDKVEVWIADLEPGPPEIQLKFAACTRTDVVIPLDIARAEKLARNLRDSLDSFYRRPTW